jgi:rare lipoprotein A (peptidoglycan hydrolase)
MAATTAAALAIPLLATPAAQGGILKKRMHVRVGDTAAVIGRAAPGVAKLQIHRGGVWRTIDRDRTTPTGRYVLRDRMRRPMSVAARVHTAAGRHRLGRLNAYRAASASWYGPGLYGNRLACGGTLRPGRLGVAHRTLRCGTKLVLWHRGHTVGVRVIDRGPYVAGREFDLTEATARRLHFHGHGTIFATR